MLKYLNLVPTIKETLLELHNNERRKRGIPLLNHNDALERAAQKHSVWMVARSNLTHNEPGHPVEKRVGDEGYNWTWVGENIADSPHNNPQEIMVAWMKSTGHRANVLNGHFKDVGFGIEQDQKGVWWWCVDFASHTE